MHRRCWVLLTEFWWANARLRCFIPWKRRLPIIADYTWLWHVSELNYLWLFWRVGIDRRPQTTDTDQQSCNHCLDIQRLDGVQTHEVFNLCTVSLCNGPICPAVFVFVLLSFVCFLLVVSVLPPSLVSFIPSSLGLLSSSGSSWSSPCHRISPLMLVCLIYIWYDLIMVLLVF